MCIFFVRYLFRPLNHFLIGLFVLLLLNFRSSLYILSTSHWIIFADIFFQSAACLFILLTQSYTNQKFLIFMKLGLSVFPFMNHAFGFKSKNSLPSLRSCRFSVFFFLRVLCLVFKFMIHFE